MSTSSREDGLSTEELRKRLYQTFKNKGVLDALKAQLRNQLIQELKYPPLTGQDPVPTAVTVKAEPVLLSACNSIVADHLHTSGYEYTLSVFCPESGLSKSQILKKEDLLQLLKISPASPLSSFTVNKENNDKGFLFSLLTQLMNSSAHSLRHDVETQTASLSSYGESLVEKMKMIDKEYQGLSSSEDKVFSFQRKLDAYRKEAEAQMEAEMNTKLQHFKEVEIAKVRAEEKAKCHKEFDQLKQDQERTYEMRAKALMEREKNAIDRLQKQQEIEEKNIYIQRQLVLKEIESLRHRDNELRLRMEAFDQTCQIHAEKVKTSDELLRRRELAVKTLEDTYDQKLKNELSRYQLELKEDFVKRTENLTESENRNKVETARIQKESAAIDARLEEHNRACSELKRLQGELETAQKQIFLLTQQKELLTERLESTGDYLSLKRGKVELQGQLQLLKTQLEETHEENRQLRAELLKPSKEQLALQTELQRLQNTRRVDEEEFNNQKQVLQTQLHAEVERCAQFKAQLLECEEKSQWMTKHVEDIKMQLRQTHQALENEVLRNPKPSLVDRSVLELGTDRLVPPDIYMDGALLRARLGYDDVCEAGGPSRGHKPAWSDPLDSDMELVAQAKARIQELQEEAEVLEEAYRSYQQRAVYATVSHMLPPKALSPQQAYLSHSPSFPRRKQDSQRRHVRSTHKQKISLKPLSPQRVQSPTLVSHDAQIPFLSAQRGVSVSEDHKQPRATVFTDYGHHLGTESPSPRDEETQNESSVSSKQLSCTSPSTSRRKYQEESAEEAAVFPQPLPDRRLSHAPLSEAVAPGDFSPELSPPQSPQLKSTAREQSSPSKLQPVFSSSESSPQPEKISLEDLTGKLSEPGHIPELLLDTAVPLSEEAPEATPSPRPRDLPEDPVDLRNQAEGPKASGSSARVVEEREDEEQKWEKERKERQERRQRELEEAKEQERQELERLEEEMLLQQTEQPEQEEETEVGKGEDEEQKEESKDDNPLEKYMKMVLEAREKQHQHNPVRQEAGRMSPEDKSLSEEKEESIAAFSLKEDEEDFW
ncbi:oral-facial-digital syndrome 1 protein homolog [Kryptolebias marmoratus]|uniref:OFD1 centriole and centriolar satellite protein n=1 Tax=Kryptolebias marmoratus TaxID=37003 RepID=A0A3Q3B4D2_KRYMA|nr:oral-facial-digital syndrome 1 protein homolog [Kryptolebias marmoratus]